MTIFGIWMIGYFSVLGFLDREDKISTWKQVAWGLVWPVFWGRTIYDYLNRATL